MVWHSLVGMHLDICAL